MSKLDKLLERSEQLAEKPENPGFMVRFADGYKQVTFAWPQPTRYYDPDGVEIGAREFFERKRETP